MSYFIRFYINDVQITFWGACIYSIARLVPWYCGHIKRWSISHHWLISKGFDLACRTVAFIRNCFMDSSFTSCSIGNIVFLMSSPMISTMTGFSWNNAATNRVLPSTVSTCQYMVYYLTCFLDACVPSWVVYRTGSCFFLCLVLDPNRCMSSL